MTDSAQFFPTNGMHANNNAAVGIGLDSPAYSLKKSLTDPSGPQMQASVDVVMGFDYNNEDSPDDPYSRDLADLAHKFSSASAVLQSPARSALFLHSLVMHNRPLSPALFYLVVHQFKLSFKIKDIVKDAKRVCLEIFSTFLHEESPLPFNWPPRLVHDAYKSILNSTIKVGIFDSLAAVAYGFLQVQIEDLARGIETGVECFNSSENTNLKKLRSLESELSYFERVLTPHLGELTHRVNVSAIAGGDADSSTASGASIRSTNTSSSTVTAVPKSDLVCQAQIVAFVSVHRYFAALVNLTPSESSGSRARRLLTGATFGTRSNENLTASNLGNTYWESGSIGANLPALCTPIWTKQPYFCSKSKGKALAFFGSRKTKKGHSLGERAIDGICKCAVCSLLLSGLAPQGLACSHCDLSVHAFCKSNITSQCKKQGRKAPVVPPSPVVTQNLTLTPEDGLDESQLIALETPQLMHEPITAAAVSDDPQEFILAPPPTTKVESSNPVPVVGVDSPKLDEPPTNADMDMPPESPGSEFVGELPSGDKLLRKGGDSIGRSNSVGSNFSNVPSTDLVPELVSVDWSNDPEMMPSESFEAGVELRNHFPAYTIPPKGVKSEAHVRLLVLLEFHQKVQYMVRFLKLYEYLMLRRWPADHDQLRIELCLDRIPQLVTLFRSLVDCMEKTKTPQTYAGMAEAVLEWLTHDNNANLKAWSADCQALSCTNNLDGIKQRIEAYKHRFPTTAPLLDMRYNKVGLLEDLRQMRLLYINLPLIATKITGDLNKLGGAYKGEAKIWKEIYKHLTSLPSTVDEVCVPLVKRINASQILSVVDKKENFGHFQNNLMANFTRTIFSHWVIAQAEVTVDKLLVTSAVKTNRNYIRERTQMLAILMRDALVLLVKDGDRFVLRPFKPGREHGQPQLAPQQQQQSHQQQVPTQLSVNDKAQRHSLIFSSSTASAMPAVVESGNQPPISRSSASFSVSQTPVSATPADLQSPLTPGAGSQLTHSSTTIGERHKLAPIFLLTKVHASLGEKSGPDHLLNIIFMNPPVLVRLLFRKSKQREQWYNLLKECATRDISNLQTSRPQSVVQPSNTVASPTNSMIDEGEEHVSTQGPTLRQGSSRRRRRLRRPSIHMDESLSQFQTILEKISSLADEGYRLLGDRFQLHEDNLLETIQAIKSNSGGDSSNSDSYDHQRLCHATMDVVRQLLPLISECLASPDQPGSPASTISSPSSSSNMHLTTTSLPESAKPGYTKQNVIGTRSSPSLYRHVSDSTGRHRPSMAASMTIDVLDRRKSYILEASSNSTNQLPPQHKARSETCTRPVSTALSGGDAPSQIGALVSNLHDLHEQFQLRDNNEHPEGESTEQSSNCDLSEVNEEHPPTPLEEANENELASASSDQDDASEVLRHLSTVTETETANNTGSSTSQTSRSRSSSTSTNGVTYVGSTNNNDGSNTDSPPVPRDSEMLRMTDQLAAATQELRMGKSPYGSGSDISQIEADEPTPDTDPESAPNFDQPANANSSPCPDTTRAAGDETEEPESIEPESIESNHDDTSSPPTPVVSLVFSVDDSDTKPGDHDASPSSPVNRNDSQKSTTSSGFVELSE